MSFEHTVEFIQAKISCCSVPYSASAKRKADSIAIGRNGDITISYSDNKLKQTFNLFALYKEEEGATGIDTVMDGKFIQFYVSTERIRLIRFATATDAKEVYNALLRLFALCKKEVNTYSNLNFEQTLDFINLRLAKWTEKGNTATFTAWINGDVRITNNRNHFFPFNLFDLEDPEVNTGFYENGIETLTCDIKSHAPLAWINFNTLKGNVAFIRLHCNTPKAELEIIRGAILHLKFLCIKS